jgi:phosphoenolpyruvate carboxykinase (ATP)
VGGFVGDHRLLSDVIKELKMQKQNSPKLESLRQLGLSNLDQVYWNLPTPRLYEEAIRRHEGVLCHSGPLLVRTGQYTGRSPKDRFLVREPGNQDEIAWGEVNQPFTPQRFEALRRRVGAYLQSRDLFVTDCYAGADERFRLPLRVISERASAALFSHIMFLREQNEERLACHEPELTILHAPSFHADPEIDGTHSDAFVLLHFSKKLIVIGGTGYAGEIKKSVFTTMNYLLPQRGVLPMHCSANCGEKGEDVALFFGLSGTGKTTLSADANRTLIGDDEHGWSDQGVFNFEGGCYAKAIGLTPETEPEIYATTHRFGTLLENVVIDPHTRRLDLHDATLTENTRAAYPVTHIANMTRDGQGEHPKQIFMLTCDAFGVLPPISRLTREQAMYHFLSGYTAKVAGTESGVTEPQAVFSPCFGAPFMALPPKTYAELLGEKIDSHCVTVWLVNTGWSGGAYGEGERVKLAYTRAMLRAAMQGDLEDVQWSEDPVFGVAVPESCPEVPAELLSPRNTWKDPDAYDAKAQELAEMFAHNFQEHAGDASNEIRQAGPRK